MSQIGVQRTKKYSVKFLCLLFNIGGGYDIHRNCFKCDVNGLYSFSCSLGTLNKGRNLSFYMNVTTSYSPIFVKVLWFFTMLLDLQVKAYLQTKEFCLNLCQIDNILFQKNCNAVKKKKTKWWRTCTLPRSGSSWTYFQSNDWYDLVHMSIRKGRWSLEFQIQISIMRTLPIYSAEFWIFSKFS